MRVPTHCLLLLSMLALGVALPAACGGAGPDPTETTASTTHLGPEDLAPRPRMESAELTTAVDEAKAKLLAPPADSFAASTPVIWLVAKLRHLPTDSRITVTWRRNADPGPLLASDAFASDRLDLTSSVRPISGTFAPGGYRVAVAVNGAEVGAREFTVVGADSPARIIDLTIGAGLDGKKKRVKKATTRFPDGAKRVVVAFDVAQAPPPGNLVVRWWRGEEAMASQDLVLGQGPYSASLENAAGLASGDYALSIELDGTALTRHGFQVGDVTSGPRIDHAAIGDTLGPDNLPVRELMSFPRDATVIQVGLRFLDIGPGQVLTVDWLAPDGIVVHTVATPIPVGGSGSLGAAFQPKTTLTPGDWTIAISLDGTRLATLPFSVE